MPPTVKSRIKAGLISIISRFLHQALMQTMIICTTDILPGLYAHLLRATRVDLKLTTGMAAVLLCTVRIASTLDLPDPRLHRTYQKPGFCARQAHMHLTRLIFSLLPAMCLYAKPAFIRDFTVGKLEHATLSAHDACRLR